MQESRQLRDSDFPGICTSSEMRPRNFREWIDYYQKNKPQSNALAGGIMVILYGGQHMGWGIFNNHLTKQPWAGGYEDEGTVFWAIISWFIAAIVGLAISTLVVNRATKMFIYIFSSILASISATLSILYSDEIYAIFPIRILAGLSFGITYPVILVHASEVAVPRLRGMIVSSVHICFLIGVFMSSASLLPVYSTRNYEIDPTQTIGVQGVICIATGVFIAIFFNRESPVFLIRRYRDTEAVNMMIRLRSESHETQEIRRDFDEFQQMVTEDDKSDLNIFSERNLKSLGLVIFLRACFVASFNMPLGLIWLESVETKMYNGVTDPSGMWLMGLRWSAILVSMFLLDSYRQKLFQVSAGVSSLILFALVIVINTSGMGYDEMTAVSILAFLFQIFSGLAVGILPDIYSCDAFNTKRKALSIAFTTSFEFLLQIFFVSCIYYLKISLTWIVGGSAVLLGLAAHYAIKIPDTSGMSLRNARNRFYN